MEASPTTRKTSLFIDFETAYLGLRNMFNRELEPALLVEKATKHGELARAVAYADWKELPEGTAEKLRAAGIEARQVDRVAPARDASGKRRDVAKDAILLEMLVDLFDAAAAPAVADVLLVGSGEKLLARAVQTLRTRFGKEVVVCGLAGAIAKELQDAATSADPLEVPPLAPADEEGLSRLVPVMEELEKRKRYLNFKYIRESIVRHGSIKAKSFDEAERLLSDAIACALVLKQKVEDKYHPGQLFTAYAINRDSPLFKKYGSGEPAPLRTEDEIRAAGGAVPSDAAAPEGAPAPADAAEPAGGGAPAVPGPEPADAIATPSFASTQAHPRRDDRGGERGERERGERGGRRRRGRGRGGDRGDRERAGREGSREGSREGPREPAREQGREDTPQPVVQDDFEGMPDDDAPASPPASPPRREHARGEGGAGDRGRHGRGRGGPSGGRGRDRGRGVERGRTGGPSQRWTDARHASRGQSETPAPALSDEEIDEERILRARGDAEARRILEERG